jgi:inner membrane protein involved in colicin E2 resistance
MAIKSAGMMFGMMAVSSKSLLKGALVLIVIHARIKARLTDSADAPAAKTKEFRTRVYVLGSE